MIKPDTCRGCPLYETGKGFALGTGDPTTAKIALILEALGRDEVDFALRPVPGRRFFETPQECDREIAIRRRDYPDVPLSVLTKGAPVVGQSGTELEMWVLPTVGLRRHDLFIDNTLRCLPPKTKKEAYPTGDERKAAEKHCRQYDRLHLFRPRALVVTLHPAAILRECTPLPLQVEDFKRARDFAAAGYKTALLIGGKSAKAFMRHSDSVLKCRGNYEIVAPDWPETYKRNFEYTASEKKSKRVKKARTEASGEENDDSKPTRRRSGRRKFTGTKESDLRPPLDFS